MYIGVDREWFKRQDFEEIGFLDGLEDDVKSIVNSFYMKVDFDKPKMDETVHLILPVVRRIVGDIAEHYLSKQESTRRTELGLLDIQYDDYERSEICSKMLTMVDVNDITDKLDLLIFDIIPRLEKYFPRLDVQAELVVLFCRNYLYELFELSKPQKNE